MTQNNDGIFTPNQKNEVFSEAINKNNHDTTYTMSGMGDKNADNGADIMGEYRDPDNGRVYRAEDRPMAAARQIKAGSINKYYIKMDSQATLFDPKDPTHVRNAKVMRGGIPLFTMKSVTATQFNNYLQYLSNKNQRFYTQARKSL